MGTNNGYAYIGPDVRCPSPSYGSDWTEIDWRRGGSDEPLEGVEQRFSGCHEVVDDDGNEQSVKWNIVSTLVSYPSENFTQKFSLSFY